MTPLFSLRRALISLVPAGALLLRLMAQPEHLDDSEGQIPATIARELWLAGPWDVFHYQLIAYQGSLVMDPLLALPGHLFLGDHLLAWHGLAVVYIALLSYAASSILARCGFGAGEWIAPVLFAAMPFVLKDGLLAMIGGHGTGIVYGMIALALAVHGGRAGRARWWPLAAGIVWALGCWYVRTTYVVLPALVLALVPLGRAAWLRFGLGVAVLPGLLLLNAHFLVEQVPRYEAVDPVGLAADLAFGAVADSGSQHGTAYPTSQLAEATGWIFREVLFAQPEATDHTLRELPGARRLGAVWVLAWLASLPLLGLALGMARRDGPGADGADTPGMWARRAATVLLPAAYVGAYLASPQRIELAAVSQVLSEFAIPSAPEVNPVRYLIPVGLGWTVLLAAGLSAAWGVPRLRGPAALLLLATAGGGSLLAVSDVVSHRSPTPLSELRASNYRSISLPGRLPPPEVHRRALNDDPDSRQYRFWALGHLALEGAGQRGDSGPRMSLAESSTQAQVGLVMGVADRRDFFDGFGAALAVQISGAQGESRARLFDEVRGMTASLTDPMTRRAYLRGLLESLPNRAELGIGSFGIEAWEAAPADAFRAAWLASDPASPEQSGNEAQSQQP